MLCMYVTVCVKYANKFNKKKKLPTYKVTVTRGSRVLGKAENGGGIFYRHVRAHSAWNEPPLCPSKISQNMLVTRSCLVPFMAVIRYPRPPK